MDWIVSPATDGRGLPDVLPSLLGALGVPGFTDTIGFGECRSAIALLIDGLGWELLHEHASDAPTLTSLSGRSITAGFPTTTVTSLTSLGTGRCSGEHGIVGYTFAWPTGELLHPLSWTLRAEGRRDVLDELPPEQVQPLPTMLQRAADAGVEVRTVTAAEFAGTGLTRAALRGGHFHGVRALGDLAAGLIEAANAGGPALCYGYHGHLDLLGHIHGPGSLPWRMQLRQIDSLVALIAEHLPPGAVMVVVADHGMVAVDPSTALDFDNDPRLRQGVRLLGGEVRARHVYTRPGATDEVLAAWREVVADRGLVLTGEQAVEEGWFGPVVADPVGQRIGDVIAVMRESGVIRSVAEPGESSLRGQHGSLTSAEQLIPALVVTG